ncbi:MAG: AbiV family abortive infection protein [Thiobacillus sp.]|nr:AbiV family abortive infection protein [Thiobacillus sp.]
MQRGLSSYKYKRIAEESLRNALRLHGDSVQLFNARSCPSAFLLSVLALEEFAKAKWVDHYYYSSVTNEGFPDYEFEQKWLSLLYSHPEKQFAFVARDIFDFSPKLVRFIQNKNLERKKQQAVYIELERIGKSVDTTGRISIPSRIKKLDAKQIISLVNQEFAQNDMYFGIPELDTVIDVQEHQFIFDWPHRSGLKGRHFRKQHTAEANSAVPSHG